MPHVRTDAAGAGGAGFAAASALLALLLVLRLVSLLVSLLVLLLVCCWSAAHEHCDPAEPGPVFQAATLKQIPVPLTPRHIPRAALTLCLVHPRPVKFFLDQLDKRCLLPTYRYPR